MERLSNIRIHTLCKVFPLQDTLIITRVGLVNQHIYIYTNDEVHDLGIVAMSNLSSNVPCEKPSDKGCNVASSNVLATLLRGIDGKDGKDGKDGYTQDLSKYYKKDEVDGKLKQKQDAIDDLDAIRANAQTGAKAVQPSELASVAKSGEYGDLKNRPYIPLEVTESTVSGWGFTKNTGNYTKPSAGIPSSDLASDVQDSLDKANSALQSVPSEYITESELETKGYATKTEVSDVLIDKVDKVEGKGLSTEDFTTELKNKVETTTDIVASQIFLEFIGDRDDFQVFSHKIGYEEHNREVCQRLIENCFTDKMSNNEVFFVTINGMRDGVPYMETAILESPAGEIVRASFVKGNINPTNLIAASIGVLGIDAEDLRSYVESGEDLFYWKYTSTLVPSVDAIGSEGDENDVYVTEFTFEEITTNGRTVKVSPELVSAIYNNRIIVIPSIRGTYIATNTFSAPLDFPVNIRMQIATGVYVYDVTLNGKGVAPQTIPTYVRVTNLLSGSLNTINGISLAKGADMQLVSSIALNGKTYTPTYGAVDLGNIEGGGEQQQLKTIFGNSIVGEGDVMDNYSMEITAEGTYTVGSIGNPRILRGGNIFPLVVDEFVSIDYGPTLHVRISSDGRLTISGAIASIPTFYLASGVIPEEFMPYNVAKLDDIQQADFDENDEESKAYIKNRSHYFQPYIVGYRLVVDDTTVGTNIAPITDYFKIGGAVYRPADMVGVEFNCQNSGQSVFVTVVEELDIDGNPSFYLRHISGNSRGGAPIMFYPAGTVKTIDSVFIPENFATKGYVEQQLGNVQKGIVDVEDPTIDVLEPNKIYVYATNTLSSITINSFSTTDALTEEYVVQFRTFPAVGEIKLPSGVMWANGVTPTLEGNTLYELSIVKTHIGETNYFKAVLTAFK